MVCPVCGGAKPNRRAKQCRACWQATPEERFWRNIDKQPDGCWLWTGSTDSDGYGLVWQGRHVKAHRFAYALVHGAIPAGLQIHHRCEDPACCNPDHLELVSPREHQARHPLSGATAGKREQTHCKRGHPLAGENVYRYRNRRKCRACNALRQREYVSRKGGGSHRS